MQNQTLDHYFTKRRKSQVKDEGYLQDQPASLRSRMEEVQEELIAESGTSSNNTPYMSTDERCIRHAKPYSYVASY